MFNHFLCIFYQQGNLLHNHRTVFKTRNLTSVQYYYLIYRFYFILSVVPKAKIHGHVHVCQLNSVEQQFLRSFFVFLGYFLHFTALILLKSTSKLLCSMSCNSGMSGVPYDYVPLKKVGCNTTELMLSFSQSFIARGTFCQFIPFLGNVIIS